ncbi:transglycosylase domain-containing protein [Kitasatospora sp. GAS204B]|uniref:transglycosylase domain-containing protein n=1 Tax=unclassified Kitasatospora TaxID=2633591 RepID=UPI0024745814|nr:transglycosylase domain-containing protein [Kitasatospora sp. GAS204B]MDH6119302.1 membrane peptidoglycan carboxypeptidase [Kitasatospora sp. GAS204B]
MAPKRSSAAQRPRRRRTSPLELAGHGIKFLGVSILSGVLLAGLALPAVGAIGLGAKDGVQSFDNIPDDFKTPTLSQASYIYDSQGNQIAKVYARDRTILTQDQMSPLSREAQVDIEDARFFQHGAIDPKGVLRAIGKNASSGDSAEGASTLTQQYVKNVFVEEAGDDQAAFKAATQKSLGRKIKELKYAIQLEKDLSKDQILTNYLNITFFNHQAYGIEAAAQRYFGKSDKDLDVAQAALLAGMVQNPSAYDPLAHPKAAQTRRDTVIDKMLQYKHITAQQAQAAKASGLELNYQAPQNGCITASNGMAFFCDYVQRVVENDPAFGASSAARQKLWTQGGLKITTTIDAGKQAAANNAVTSQVKVTDSVAAAMTMVKPGTGEILAMAQTRPFGLDASQHQTVVNLNVDAAMGGGSGFQPGSTFKAIVAAAALDSGSAQLNTAFPSPPQMPYPDMSTCGQTWKNSTNKPATVSNDSPSEAGPFMMPEAMARSINTYFVSLEQSIGLCAVTQMANKLGIKAQASGAALQQVPSMTLGTQLVSPLDMAGVYATFASRGVHCDPIAIKSVTGIDGKQLAVPQANCQQVIQQNTADSINTLLKGVTEKSGTGGQLNLDDNRPIAGKTGTTDQRKAAWFDGYTPDLVGVVWLGGPEGSVPMDGNIVIGGHRFPDGVYGATGPGPMWQQAMSQAVAGTPVSQFNLIPNAPSATASTDTPAQNPAQPPNPGNPPANPPTTAGLDTTNPVPPITAGPPQGGTIGGGFSLPPGMIGGGGTGKPGRPGHH